MACAAVRDTLPARWRRDGVSVRRVDRVRSTWNSPRSIAIIGRAEAQRNRTGEPNCISSRTESELALGHVEWLIVSLLPAATEGWLLKQLGAPLALFHSWQRRLKTPPL